MSAWESFKKFYRVLRWVVLVGMVLAILLLLKKSPAPQVRADPRAAERVEQKIQQTQQAVNSGEKHTLALDEAELNSLLQNSLALNPPGGATLPSPSSDAQPTLEELQSNVRDVRVQLGEDKVTAYVLFDFHGTDLSLNLEGRLHVVNGYLRLEPTAGSIGSMPIPQSTLESAVKKLFDSPENREKFHVPANVSDIRVENGQINVYYNP